MRRNLAQHRWPNHTSRGFTLAEVLIAVAILLIGVVFALKIFPPGYDAFITAQQTTVAQRLINNTLNNFEADPDSLPDAILPVDQNIQGSPLPCRFDDLSMVDWRSVGTGVWQDFGALTYPDSDDAWPLWEPVSVRAMRRVIGEKTVIPTNVSSAVAFAPKAILRFGPIQTDAYNSVTIYDLRYRKVAPAQLNWLTSGSATTTLSDQLYYAMNSACNTINLLNGGLYTGSSAVRLSFCCQQVPPATLGALPVVQQVTTQTMTVQTSGYLDVSSTDGTAIRLTISPGQITLPAGWQFVPGSEQINRAYLPSPSTTDPSTLQSGQYMLQSESTSAQLLGVIYFAKSDAGRTVKIDYTVADWNILHEDLKVDNDGYFTLALPNPKLTNRPAAPREPNSWGLYNPMAAGNANATAVMVLVDIASGYAYTINYDASNSNVPYQGVNAGALAPSPTTVALNVSDATHGHLRVGGFSAGAYNWNAFAGRTLRVFYRAHRDWTLQIYKPPTQFWYTTQATLDWDKYAFSTATNEVSVPSVYAGQSVAVDYATAPIACRVIADNSGTLTVDKTHALQMLSVFGVMKASVGIYSTAGALIKTDTVIVNTTSNQLVLSTDVPRLTGGEQIVDLHIVDHRPRYVPVLGEIHSVPSATSTVCAFNLWHPLIGSYPNAVRGVSVTVRALWVQQHSGQTYTLDDSSPSATVRTTNERWQARSQTVVLPAVKE